MLCLQDKSKCQESKYNTQIVEHHNQLHQCNRQITNLEEEVRVLAQEKMDINHIRKELLHSTIVAHDLELQTSVQDVKESERKHYIGITRQQKKIVREAGTRIDKKYLLLSVLTEKVRRLKILTIT